MKTIRLLLSVVIIGAYCLSAFTASAQSKSLPIDSLGSAVSHNLLLVRQVYGSLSSSSLLNTNGSKTLWFQSYNPNGVPKQSDLTAMVVTNPFAFMIARPTNDWVSAYVSYNSVEGYQLFWAGVGFQLVQSNGVWQVPANVLTNLQNMIGYYEPIAEKNAVGARLNLRDSNENLLQQIYLEVDWNNSTHVGTILNLTQYVGQHGEMVVTYGQFDQYGNQTNSYDVAFALDEDKGGAVLAPATVKAGFTPAWDSLIKVLQPPVVALTNVSSLKHIGTSPLVEITVTNTMTVYFSANTSEGETANGFTVKLLQSGVDLPVVPYSIPQGASSLGVTLPPGVYHIDFTWPQLAPAQVYPQWYYNNGGAVVASPVSPSAG